MKSFITSMKFILLMHVNVKLSTIVDIICMINTTSKSFKTRKIFIFHHFTFHERLKFHAQLSCACKNFITAGLELFTHTYFESR